MDTNARAALQGSRNGLAAAVYILLVAFLAVNGEGLFGGQPPPGWVWLAPAFGMLFFVVSALVTGSLVLWQPVKLLMDGKKKEAGMMLCGAGTTLVAVLLLVIGIALLVR
jgi:hypothetical protein